MISIEPEEQDWQKSTNEQIEKSEQWRKIRQYRDEYCQQMADALNFSRTEPMSPEEKAGRELVVHHLYRRSRMEEKVKEAKEGREEPKDLLEHLDEQQIEAYFTNFLESSYQKQEDILIKGPQSLFDVLDIQIDNSSYWHLEEGMAWGISDSVGLALNTLGKIWGNTVIHFIQKHNGENLTQDERETFDSIVSTAIFSGRESSMLSWLERDQALFTSALISRSMNFDEDTRGMVTQECVPLLRDYDVDPKDAIANASIVEKLDVLHFLPSFHAHALFGADDPEGNWMPEQYLGDTWEHGKACDIAREILALEPTPFIRYAEQLAEKRIAEEEEQFTLEESYNGDEIIEQPNAYWSRLPEMMSEDSSHIALDAEGVFDHSGMLQSVTLSSEEISKKLSIRDVCADYRFNPFSEESDTDLPLLLQHLHRPAMRSLIEEDLGIDLKSIPLASQIHLLRFLAGKNADTFTKLRSVLQEHPAQVETILKSFFACSEDPSMGESILDLVHLDRSGEILRAYTDIADAAEEDAKGILAMYTKANPQGELDYKDFYTMLLHQAHVTLKNTEETLKEITQATVPSEERNLRIERVIQHAVTLLLGEEKRVHQLRLLVGTLKKMAPSELKKLDVRSLSALKIRGPVKLEDLRTKAEYSKTLQSIRTVIHKTFKQYADDFEHILEHDEKTQMFYCTCNGEIIACFSVSPMEGGMRYADWLASNPHAPVQHLAESVVVTGLDTLDPAKGDYFITKPLRPMQIAVEGLEAVAFGVMQDEQEHTYMQCRRMPEERNAYIGHTLTDEEIAELGEICTEEEKEFKKDLRGKSLKVCRVLFRKRSLREKFSEEEFILRKMKELSEKDEEGRNYVLTRYIADPSNSAITQRYLCVFEPSLLNDSEEQTIRERAERFHEEERREAERARASTEEKERPTEDQTS